MSAPAKPLVLIFGAGANIGATLIREFEKAGYLVAAVSRDDSAAKAAGAHFSLPANLSDPAAIPGIFDHLRNELNVFPSVIVWNAATRSPAPDKGNIFSVPLEDVEKDLAVAVKSPWLALNEAVKGWKEGERATFIYTGNVMAKGVFPHPDFTSLGTSKRAASYVVEAADVAYKGKSWRFHYADERTVEGKPMGHKPNAASHAAMYLKLARADVDKYPTYVMFVEGEQMGLEKK